MYPRLELRTSGDYELMAVVDAISEIECAPFFTGLLTKSQSEQRNGVADFQAHVLATLEAAIPYVSWQSECMAGTRHLDSIDICGRGDGYMVVIELDKHRADQVAKKFLSRMAILNDIKVLYVALCYPGTQAMNENECRKYFGYCESLATRLGGSFAGFIIG